MLEEDVKGDLLSSTSMSLGIASFLSGSLASYLVLAHSGTCANVVLTVATAMFLRSTHALYRLTVHRDGAAFQFGKRVLRFI